MHPQTKQVAFDIPTTHPNSLISKTMSGHPGQKPTGNPKPNAPPILALNHNGHVVAKNRNSGTPAKKAQPHPQHSKRGQQLVAKNPSHQDTHEVKTPDKTKVVERFKMVSKSEWDVPGSTTSVSTVVTVTQTKQDGPTKHVSSSGSGSTGAANKKKNHNNNPEKNHHRKVTQTHPTTATGTSGTGANKSTTTGEPRRGPPHKATLTTAPPPTSTRQSPATGAGEKMNSATQQTTTGEPKRGPPYKATLTTRPPPTSTHQSAATGPGKKINNAAHQHRQQSSRPPTTATTTTKNQQQQANKHTGHRSSHANKSKRKPMDHNTSTTSTTTKEQMKYVHRFDHSQTKMSASDRLLMLHGQQHPMSEKHTITAGPGNQPSGGSLSHQALVPSSHTTSSSSSSNLIQPSQLLPQPFFLSSLELSKLSQIHNAHASFSPRGVQQQPSKGSVKVHVSRTTTSSLHHPPSS
ncbi:hypothetical protein PCASD_21482 [Puccinia coronata f. sp. avenae]|uniref:Uncharacterized protein n=1 Tax=Puccinia coronata f. sp. avenae TaxID=200324 RepID=A0A2N5S9J8_9BASI|nr:hypothetical protein PCASD_21482 [Puccinia coronata f. sp. avenae]